MNRKKSEVLERCLSYIDPETRRRVGFEMTILGEWETCHRDIIQKAEEEEEGLVTEGIREELVNLCKYFYLKGISDVHNKLNTWTYKDSPSA